jgi:Ca2+-binding RTX toxin-like protein
LAFSTLSGSDGITSLVGSTGVDVATLVTLSENVFIGGNTGDDIITTALGTGSNNLTNFNVRMGGGDDAYTSNDNILNSFISLDGETLANDGNDTFAGGGAANTIINSEIVGRGGNDVFTALAVNTSTVNGNTGNDQITFTGSTNSTILGGQGADTIQSTAGAAGASNLMTVNGNRGGDTLTLLGSGYTGTVYGGQGDDTINANAVTTAAAAALAATATGVTLNGDLGNDGITGTTGIDTINGGDGNDTIDGGTGANIISGGAGADIFTINEGTDGLMTAGTSTGFITISDFGATAAAATSDTLNLDTAGGAIVNNAAAASGGVSLFADLLANAAGLVADGDVDTVTITGAVAWAGNYLVVEDGTAAGGFDVADTVIKVGGLTNFVGANNAVLLT